MPARIAPAVAPFSPLVQNWLDKTLPAGQVPLALFTALANDERLFDKFFSGGLLDRGHLTLRQREIVINRTTARCGSAYEWGVHVKIFAARAGFTSDQIESLATGGQDDQCWLPDDAVLIALCDALHERCNINDDQWTELRETFSELAIIELVMVAGFYRTVSYLTNVLCLPLEPGSAPLLQS